MSGERIRVRLKSFDSRVVDSSTQLIVESAKKAGALIVGPVPLPTKIKKYIVLKSPHVNITAREQFEMRIYRRLIDIYDVSADAMSILMGIELPAGIDIEIKN